MERKLTKPWNIKRFARKGNRYEFAFVGETVSSIRFGGDIRIYLNDDFMTRIDLWMPFTFTQYGQSQTFHPHASTTAALLLSLVGCTVIKATAGDQIPLGLEFDNDIVIEAPSAQSEYRWEAWQINDKHGFHVVCAIGGNLAIWNPDSESSKRRNQEGNQWFD